jgi:signal transduction histidine kinase
MSLRTKLTLWYSGILLVSLVIVGFLTYHEFVIEPRQARKHGQAQDPKWEEAVEVALKGGVPCLILAIAGGWWLTRQAFRPLQRLTEAAESIHAGNLKRQLPVTGSRDEIARLTRVFNAMTVRLDESFERERQFTLNASHELKTPLALMRSELETALHAPDASPSTQERTASLLDEVERLTQIVDGLTFLTKADAGLVTFKRESMRLDELVHEAQSDAHVLALQMKVKVEVGQCDEAFIVGDRHRIRQLLLILTDNAIKYNNPSGMLRISVAANENTVELRVTNTGPGIQPQELPRVFDRFFRGHAAESKGSEGCGLGLSIARSIVAAHGADMDISSTPGGLTDVVVRFRAARPEEQLAPLAAVV